MNDILILKFPHALTFGGAERNTILVVEELQKKGFNFWLVASCPILLREFRARKWSARRNWAGVEPVFKWAILLWPLGAIFAAINLFFILAYYRWRRRVKILYCLSLTEKILATLPARLLGMKVFWVEHFTVEDWLSKNPLKVFYRWLSGSVTMIAISKFIADQLVDLIGVKREKISVVYYGVDLIKFKMREFRWENAARYNIGCVARLEAEKGIEYLIKAVKIVKEFIPFVRLIIVGEGPERKKLVWLSERLGLKEQIQWVGYQKEIEKWYVFFDTLVLPSIKRESFGVTLIEAMACGVPVVGSRIGGVPEIIDHKTDGLLANPGDSQHLADQLMYLFNNRSKVREMVMAARSKIETKFSLERMVRDYYLLFRK